MKSNSEDLQYVYTPKLKSLRPLLNEWTGIVLRYCALSRFCDNPWWFNERATLSTLAGAAWSLPDWVALEEFKTLKRDSVPSTKVEQGQLTPGRCDLYVSNKKYDFAFEAKQAWQSIGKNSGGMKYVCLAMGKAWTDAGNLDVDEASHRLAATFIVPYIPSVQAKNADDLAVREAVTKWIENLLKELKQSDKLAAVAYVFPAKAKKFRNDNGVAFPGIVLLIQERIKGNKISRDK